MNLFAESRGEPVESPENTAEALVEEEVIRRVLDGDTASFEWIMRRYNQRLFRVVRSIVGDEAEAEDVMQEAYLHAYEHLRQFEGRSAFSTWLTKIAVYEATNRRRKLRRLRLVAPGHAETDAMTSSSINRDATQEASLNELRHLLASAVDALPPDLRLVFTLRMVEGLSTLQTAECLSLTPSNVKVRLHRSRSALQSWIDNRIGEEVRRLYVFAGEHCDRVVQKVLERLAQDRASGEPAGNSFPV
ncbi:RNA polymerase sigma factor [Singulisphaera sp. Ch08]|uniref:RNA polymerase sigma factor n=1 Tax=Singulisphaera sp. Ch08 TaxID=3120278 RepID=A0AAU7C9T9_9BACT